MTEKVAQAMSSANQQLDALKVRDLTRLQGGA
jgi:hypothetical protein